MAEKRSHDLIAEHEAELQKLKEKQAEEIRKAAFQEYPKAIEVPADPPAPEKKTVTVIVNNAEEEKAALAKHSTKDKK
jgi:hypothetical protein